jgi:hypothetical protein
MEHRWHGHKRANHAEDGCLTGAGISVADVDSQDKVALGGVNAVVSVRTSGCQKVVSADGVRWYHGRDELDDLPARELDVFGAVPASFHGVSVAHDGA